MALSITGRPIEKGQRKDSDPLHSTESLAQSLATIAQPIQLTTNVTTLAGGTATGDKDLYTLADGFEGHEKEVIMLATGEAKLDLLGTATRLTYENQDDYTYLRFTGGKWRVLVSSGLNLGFGTATSGGDPHFVSDDITHASHAALPSSLPTATGLRAIAIADNANAPGGSGIAIGVGADSGSGGLNVMIGAGTFGAGTDLSNRDTAIGANAESAGGGNVAIGSSSSAQGGQGIAIGSEASTRVLAGIAIGDEARAQATSTDDNGAIAIGRAALADGQGAICISPFNGEAQFPDAIALGRRASATASSCCKIEGTGAISIPEGTTAQRPTNRAGWIRYNTTLSQVEFNDGSTWKQLATI